MALPVVELLQGAADEDVNLLGLRLVHILCRDELSFHEVLRAGGVALILSKLDAPENIASVDIARAAMLAIGNITFQVCLISHCSLVFAHRWPKSDRRCVRVASFAVLLQRIMTVTGLLL